MIEKIPIFNSPIQDFLRYTIIDSPYVFIDLWSVVHLGSGLILGFLFITYYPKKYSWLIVLALLIIYEIVEVFLTGILFVAEKPVDTYWDLIVGMVGFFLSYNLFRKKSTLT